MPGLSYTGGTYVAGALLTEPAAPGSTVNVHGGGYTNVAGFQQPQTGIAIHGGGKTSVVSYQQPQATLTVHGGGRTAISSFQQPTVTITVHGGGRTSIGQPQSTPRIHGGGLVSISRPGLRTTGGGRITVTVQAAKEPVYVYAAATPGYGSKKRPPGVYRLRFCTVTRPLSSNALLEFAGGRGLPSGTAAPVRPVIQVESPAGVLTEYTESQITTELPGVYHLLVEMLEAGEWVWEAQGFAGGGSGGGALVGSTGEIPWQISPALKT